MSYMYKREVDGLKVTQCMFIVFVILHKISRDNSRMQHWKKTLQIWVNFYIQKNIFFFHVVLSIITCFIEYTKYTMIKPWANYHYNIIREANPKVANWIDEIPKHKLALAWDETKDGACLE